MQAKLSATPLSSAAHDGMAYDYASDSDFSDCENKEEDEVHSRVSPSSAGKLANAKPPMSASEVSADLEVLSLSSFDCSSLSDSPIMNTGILPDESPRAKIIHIRQHAHKTWKALVMYRYTGKITFNKLTSNSSECTGAGVADALACSPKPMYRIAEETKMDHLRKLCMQAIMADLTKANIARETFSSFSSRYREILEAETDLLVKLLCSKECTEEVERVMQESASKPHCGLAIAMVWRKVAACGGL